MKSASDQIYEWARERPQFSLIVMSVLLIASLLILVPGVEPAGHGGRHLR